LKLGGKGVEGRNIGVERESWGSQFGFIMAAAGSAIGLGNIWRFPYMAGENGGGAFILIYLVAVILIGFTVLLCEFAVGRGGQANAISSFRKLVPGTYWWIAGAFGVMAALLIMSFYIVVSGWTMAYTWLTLSGQLTNVPAYQLSDIFHEYAARPIAPIVWMSIFLALTVWITATGIKSGIERWNKILMPMVFIILIVFMIRGLTLEGSMEGVRFLLQPDFSKVTATTVLMALGQAFFSLSLGMGIMITYGSYLKRKENMPSSAATVVGLDTTISIIAGLAIFPALFVVGLDPASGPGLVFMVLPAVFDSLPLGVLFGTLFFFLLAIAALTSAVSIFEVLVALIKERFNLSRAFTATTVGLFIFVCGVTASLSWGPWSHVTIPFPGLGDLSLFAFYDRLSALIMLPMAGLLTCLFVAWVWKFRNSIGEITNDGELHFWWLPVFKFMTGIVAPAVIFLVLLNGLGILRIIGGWLGIGSD